MTKLTLTQISQLKDTLLTAAQATPRVVDGWCKATALGSILKSINVDYKELGYATVRALLQDLFGPEYAERGKGAQLEYMVVPVPSSAVPQEPMVEVPTLTQEQRNDLKTKVYAAAKASGSLVEGWSKATSLGAALKAADINFKALGFKNMESFLRELYLEAFDMRGEAPKHEFRIRMWKTPTVDTSLRTPITSEQKEDYKTKIIAAAKGSPCLSSGWCRATDLGGILKAADVNFKAMGYTLHDFLKEVFGADFEMRGEIPKHEYKVPFADVAEDDVLSPTPDKKPKHSIGKKPGGAYKRLISFAFFPKPANCQRHGLDVAMQKLAEKALAEHWYFGDVDPGDFPILKNYFLMTFDRLQSEDEAHSDDPSWEPKMKVVDNVNNTFGIPKYDKKTGSVSYTYPKQVLLFDTGLVDKLYEPIYAVFVTNSTGSIPWKFYKFISGSGEDKEHMFLAKLYGDKFPARAKYYESTLDLVYDVSKTIGSYNWGHIIERCDRLPLEFLEDFCPAELKASTDADGKVNFAALAQRIKNTPRVFKKIQRGIEEAIYHALKRVEWNFKTAIPIYYPGRKAMSLLLPLSLVGDNNEIDAALALEISNVYIAHTILTLDMAYANARLITRPDSDWLTPSTITLSSSSSSDTPIDAEE